MSRQRILVTWIGHTDLRVMASSLPEEERDKLLKNLGGLPAVRDSRGPIRTLLDTEQFDKVYLFSNYPAPANRLFARWLGNSPEVCQLPITDPTDYAAIFTAVDGELARITSQVDSQALDLCVLLSPGTPAMAAVWVLLGKSRYPATFYQTHQGRAWVTDIPFDLAVDFVPELLRQPDSYLQHLASRSPQEVEGFESIIGESQAIRMAVGRSRKTALRDVSVLLLGESGTGKELFARAIHNASHRGKGPFVPVNCAAVPHELLESELFGHIKGAFSGAVADRDGAFKLAHNGTLFLDEVGECDPQVQAKLLRALQPVTGGGPCEREFRPVGSDTAVKANVRVIAATNRDLVAAVRDSGFRGDLYYRLAVIAIKLPPLRDRKSDIPLLATALLEQINRQFSAQEPGYKHKTLSASAKAFVKKHPWPGNVRELFNSLVQAAVMAEADTLEAGDIAAATTTVPERAQTEVLDQPLGEGFDLANLLEEVQRHYLKRAMTEAQGIKSRAARLLGYKNYQTLDAQLRRFGIEWRR